MQEGSSACLAGLVMIAVESLNSFLQKKQSKAMATGLSALRYDQTLTWNLLWQLEHDFAIWQVQCRKATR